MSNTYRTFPPLFFCAEGTTPKRVPCNNCGAEDLRLIRSLGSVRLACPECGDTGPIAWTLDAAVSRYIAQSGGPSETPNRREESF